MVIGMLKYSIIIKEPIIFTIEDINCTVDWDMVLLILSISLVILLINSPWVVVSKNIIGKD